MINKRFLLLFVVFLIVGVGTATAALNNAEGYYALDTGSGTTAIDSSVNGFDGNINGSSWASTANAKLGNSALIFDGTNDEVRIPSFVSGTSGTVSMWVRLDTTSNQQFISKSDNTMNMQLFSGQIYARAPDSGSFVIHPATISTSTWYHLVFTWDGTNYNLYVNNVVETLANSGLTTTTAQDVIFGSSGASAFVDGTIDELAIYDRALSSAEVSDLYNSGTGFNPYSSAPTSSNFSITAQDSYTTSSLSNFSALIDGTTYTTTNGTITTDILDNSTSLYNITISSNESGGYFNRAYTDYNVSTNLQAGLHQAEITFYAENRVSGASVTNFTATAPNSQSNTDTNPYLNVTTGELEYTFNKSGYYDTTTTANLSALETSNATFEVYDHQINVTVDDGITNTTITNFSGWIYSYNHTSFNETFNTSTGNVLLNVTTGSYQIFVDNPNYAVDKDTNYQNVTATGNSSTANFTLLPDPSSVDISIYDEATGSLLAQQVNITFTSGTNQYMYSTSTGEVFAGNLTAGTYNVRFETSGYSDRTYVLTVGERTTQTLAAYLTTSTETVSFNVEDSGTDEAIQGASFTMSAFVNGTIQVVESKTSDISGQVIFTYDAGEAYIFTVSADGYIDKQFTLDPIQELEYTVTMQRTSDISNRQSYTGYRVVYTPKTYVTNQTGNFTWTITSATGNLQNYSMSFCINASCTDYAGTNANGETITHPYNLSGYGLGDEVIINYEVLTSTAETQSFSFPYPIAGSTASGISDQQCTDYGLGVLDCIIAGTLMTVLVVGAASYWAGAVAATIIGMLALGVMYYIGIFSLWTIIITLIIGFVYIAWRAGK